MFPEITRIHNHDLAALQLWQNQVDWKRSLPPTELQLLQEAEQNYAAFSKTPVTAELLPVSPSALPEQMQYEDSQQTFHPAALSYAQKWCMREGEERAYPAG